MTRSLRRVVHVADPEEAGPCTLRLVRLVQTLLPDIEHAVVVVGHGAHRRLAERCGLQVRTVIPAPAGWTGAFAGRVAARIAALADPEPGVGGEVDGQSVVVAWGGRALRVGEAIAPRAAGAVAWLGSREEVDRTDRWASGLPLLCASGPAMCETGGCRACPVETTAELLEPAVLPAAPESTHPRAALHRRWGCASGELVLGLLNEPVEFADARLACYAAAIACVGGRRCRVVLHPLARGAERWMAWSHATGLNGAVVLDPELAEPWRVAAGLDAVLVAGITRVDGARPGGVGRCLAASPLPALEAMAAGVPVITEQWELLPQAVRQLGNAQCLAVPPDDRVAIARLILRLHDDPTWREGVAESGRRAALGGCEAARFATHLRAVLEGVVARRGVGLQSARNAAAESW